MYQYSRHRHVRFSHTKKVLFKVNSETPLKINVPSFSSVVVMAVKSPNRILLVFKGNECREHIGWLSIVDERSEIQCTEILDEYATFGYFFRYGVCSKQISWLSWATSFFRHFIKWYVLSCLPSSWDDRLNKNIVYFVVQRMLIFLTISLTGYNRYSGTCIWERFRWRAKGQVP